MFWIEPCETSTSARDEGDRQQHVQDRAHQVLVEVAQALAAAAARCRGSARPRRRCRPPAESEVLHRQPEHLAEVRQRRLAAVVLPVGVRQERRRRVERHVPGRGVERARRRSCSTAGSTAVRRMMYSSIQPASEKMIRLLGVVLPVLLARRLDAEDAVERGARAGPNSGVRNTRSPV